MKKCCYVNCDKDSTVQGFVYGHHKGEDREDSLIPVSACDEHSKNKSFFPNIFYAKKEGNE